MPFSVRDWFPCDLARNDEFGKTLYVGVYTDEIVVHTDEDGVISLPPITFVFRLNIEPQEAAPDPLRVVLGILDAEGRAFAQVKGHVPPALARGTRLNLNFSFSDLILPGPGEYRLQFSLGEYSYEDRLLIRVHEPPQKGETNEDVAGGDL